MICFFFLTSTKSKNQKGTHFSLGIKNPFLKLSSNERIPKKSPIFLCYSQISILAGTNLIMLLLFFFCNPRLIPKKIHLPFDFRENSSSFDLRENPFKTPKENQKNCFSFAPCVFWICFRGLFAVVPLDLNFTNPKSTSYLTTPKSRVLFSLYFKILGFYLTRNLHQS